jgi:hypothetical protein
MHELVARVNNFRNRLAHNEPVFSTRTGLHDRLADAEALLKLISPATSAAAKPTRQCRRSRPPAM